MAIKSYKQVLASVTDMQTRINDMLMQAQKESNRSQAGNFSVQNTTVEELETLMCEKFGLTFTKNNAGSSDAWLDQAHVILSPQGKNCLIQVMSY